MEIMNWKGLLKIFMINTKIKDNTTLDLNP
jgi:hypothetical protein